MQPYWHSSVPYAASKCVCVCNSLSSILVNICLTLRKRSCSARLYFPIHTLEGVGCKLSTFKKLPWAAKVRPYSPLTENHNTK